MQREAHRRRRPARIGVQHRHDDRHVRPADRDDQQEADREAQHGDGEEHPRTLIGQEIADEAEDRRERAEVDDVARGQQDRLAAHIAVELGEGDHRAAEGDRADRDAQAQLDPALGENLPRFGDAERIGVEIGRRPDQHRRQPHERVEGGHKLRHVGHLDAACRRDADGGTNANGGEDFDDGFPVHRETRCLGDAGHVRNQRRHHGNRHADDAHAVAALARRRR